jgi:hypothetical protein
MNNHNISSLLTLGSNIFAGTSTNSGPSGIYISTNNGLSWTQTSLNNQYVYSLAALGNNIFASTGTTSGPSGVYLSTNNGTNWTQTTLNNQYVYSLAALGNNIFAGTWGSGVYLSTNNGTNWTQTALNNTTIWSFATLGTNILAGTDSGVFLSTNNGTNWINRNQGFISIPSVHALTIANNYIFAGTSAYSVWRRPLSDFTGIKYVSTEIPKSFNLEQNYPNPFNPTTTIKFNLPNAGNVSLKLYDVLGKEVDNLFKGSLSAGYYQMNFNASSLSSGVYFYRLETENFSDIKRMVLVK